MRQAVIGACLAWLFVAVGVLAIFIDMAPLMDPAVRARLPFLAPAIILTLAFIPAFPISELLFYRRRQGLIWGSYEKQPRVFIGQPR